MKKILVASDSFKGSLTSIEIGNIFKEVMPETKVLSISDGGEGFVDSIIFNSNEKVNVIYVDSFDDMKNEVRVKVAAIGDEAFIDVASIVGLYNYPHTSAYKKTSYGVGYVLKKLQENFKKIYIGLGGSSTSDGGFGAALGFGFRFLDAHGTEILNLSDASKIVEVIEPEIKAEFIGFTDVTNPLLGKEGAVNVFGKQKWLTGKELIFIEDWLKTYSELKKEGVETPGAGAAGGLGYFLNSYLGAQLRSGIEKIMGLSDIENLSNKYDYLITGEGKFDNQSFYGKVPIEIAKVSKTKNILIAGMISADKDELNKYYCRWYQIIKPGETVEESMSNTKDRLIKIARELANE